MKNFKTQVLDSRNIPHISEQKKDCYCNLCEKHYTKAGFSRHYKRKHLADDNAFAKEGARLYELDKLKELAKAKAEII